MKRFPAAMMFFWFLSAIGCAPALIGGGAVGGYKVGTDERSVGRFWDDAAITTEVNAALIKDPDVKARKIDVDTVEGVVILTGVVETDKEASRAVEIARGVSGVKSVKNNLQIGSKTVGQAMDDAVLGSKIKAKLFKEPGIRSLNIDVDVNKGVVSLTGIVKDQNQKARVMEIARTTDGTAGIVDNLNVKNP